MKHIKSVKSCFK